MLSVCIPVYRYDARPLVGELVRQAAALREAVEILVYDDASPDDGDWGRETLRDLAGIRYVVLPRNVGRAAIRNRMARAASHDLLLLLDADGAVPANFLETYLQYVAAITDTRLPETTGEEIVVVGGREYAAVPPARAELGLHWWYGTRRESRVSRRERAHWRGFQSNNFLVSRSVLLRHPFPEEGEGYGHEDTLWGQQLAGSGVWLYHLANPVVHLGLEPADVFLDKQRQAIANLRRLRSAHPHLRTRLTELAERLPALRFLLPVLPGEPALRRYLTSRPRPSLLALDLLKLRWWLAEG